MLNLSCNDSDLFGDVVVTVDDVTHWLDAVPHLQHCANHRRLYYAKHWDLLNKIKESKRAGLFDSVISDFLQSDEPCDVASLYATQYAQ